MSGVVLSAWYVASIRFFSVHLSQDSLNVAPIIVMARWAQFSQDTLCVVMWYTEHSSYRTVWVSSNYPPFCVHSIQWISFPQRWTDADDMCYEKSVWKGWVLSWVLKDNEDEERRIFSDGELETTRALYWKGHASAFFQVAVRNSEKILRGNTGRQNNVERPAVGVATLEQHTYHTRRQDNGETGSWRGHTLSAHLPHKTSG